MIETNIGDGELTSVLEGMNWDFLRTKPKEFIVKMIIKKIKKQDWRVKGEKDRKRVTVTPVTTRDESGPMIGSSIFVYELYRGWSGEELGSRGGNCKVRIREDEDSSYITTFILKKDLTYGED